MLKNRVDRLVMILKDLALDALVLNPGPSLTYLTGLSFHLMERPVAAIFTCDGELGIVLPELEALKLQQIPYPLKAFTFNDNPATWESVYRQAVQCFDLNGKTVGVEPTRLRVLELRLLEMAAPEAVFNGAQAGLARLRMQKEAGEIDFMRQAVQAAQRALQAALSLARVGMTERELASELTMQLLRSGSDSELPFPPIVSSGPNSANPHASPSDRKLTPGDLLVIDWGAAVGGYISDLTRTLCVGEVDAEYLRIAEIVLQANQAGREAVRPGIAAGMVDRAARTVIEAGGYGVYFTHRTGHGLGMEAHEDPYMFGENTLILQPGMTFTVEPGIYLPGRGGVRIEDNVVVTAQGADTLSDLPRQLGIIAA